MALVGENDYIHYGSNVVFKIDILFVLTIIYTIFF